ncbi:unnamed protein product [Cylicocyclus nassatus]|uniref:C-type lectin domain-containing protein n=1 Tax=Cylicocyclus nassatus TaxID=53992 RepID=A0AA36DTD1_CYLNA|nr:unnamed protein product [Cylicocyclus nassatus]
MSSLKLLLVLLIPSIKAFVNLNTTEQLPRGVNQLHGLSHLSASNAEFPARCESEWTLFAKTDACYKTFFGKTFDSAEYICSTYRGHLTSIHSYEENNFIAELTKMDKPTSTYTDFTWIGLHLKTNSKKWTWTDGTEVDFGPWAKGCPDRGNGKCALLINEVHLNDPHGLYYHTWADWPCDQKLRIFVCKKMALH